MFLKHTFITMMTDRFSNTKLKRGVEWLSIILEQLFW